jgi:hypothetical protein
MNIETYQSHFKKGIGERGRKNGCNEPNHGAMYAYMEMLQQLPLDN